MEKQDQILIEIAASNDRINGFDASPPDVKLAYPLGVWIMKDRQSVNRVTVAVVSVRLRLATHWPGGNG